MNLQVLTFTELLIIFFVAIELVVVVVALIAMTYVRRSTLRRQEAYESVKATLFQLITRIGPGGDPTAMAQALTVLSQLTKDQARRLLTELAEVSGNDGAGTDPVFAELYMGAGLASEARTNATARPWERLRAIREARALADPARLLERLVRDEVPDVRLGAFEALCSLGRAQEALVALPLIAFDGRLNRIRAIDSLSASRPFPTEDVDALAYAEHAEIRQVAVAALGQALQRTTLETIVHAVTDTNAEVRIQALKALAELREPSTLQVCLGALEDARWEVRSEAARTCGVLGQGGAAEALGRLLQDPAEWVRHNAALGLIKCGPQGVATLRAAAAKGIDSASAALAEARLAPAEETPDRMGRATGQVVSPMGGAAGGASRG
jgi:HEAT repeat protein